MLLLHDLGFRSYCARSPGLAILHKLQGCQHKRALDPDEGKCSFDIMKLAAEARSDAASITVECGHQSGHAVKKLVPASRFELLTPRV